MNYTSTAAAKRVPEPLARPVGVARSVHLDADLLPFAARTEFELLPRSMQEGLLDPVTRAVMRDWAREQGYAALVAALAPRAFYFHALEVLVGRWQHVEGPHPLVDVRWDTSRGTILLVQRGFAIERPTLDDVARMSSELLRDLAEPLHALGLEGSGRDALDNAPAPDGDDPFPWTRVTGFQPVRESW